MDAITSTTPTTTATTVITPNPNKTQLIKQILNEIGAIKLNPPEGWHEKVRNRLANYKVEAHDMTIYGIRSREMEKAGLKSPTNTQRRRSKRLRNSVPHVSTPKENSNILVSVSQMNDMLRLVAEFGGFDRFIEVAKSLKQLKSFNK